MGSARSTAATLQPDLVVSMLSVRLRNPTLHADSAFTSGSQH